MLQAQAALLQLHAPLVFLPLLVTWNNLAMLSIFRSEILLMGSKYGLHLCACSLITTCRWSLRCNWGEHSLVKLTLLFIRTSSSERLMRVMSLQQPYVLHTSRTESSVLQFTVSSQCYEDTFSTCTCHENYTSWELHIMRRKPCLHDGSAYVQSDLLNMYQSCYLVAHHSSEEFLLTCSCPGLSS